MSQHDGGPAFPQTYRADGHSSWSDGYGGMALRDWFAGQALSGIIASYSGSDVKLPTAKMAALAAYDFADAMLVARTAEEQS